MSSGARLTIAVLLVAVTSVGIVAAAAAAFVHYTGTVDIEVHERDGNDISLTIPASIAQAAIACLPGEAMVLDGAEAARWFPLVETVVRRVDRMPDAVLVEVDDGDENVRVEKRNGRLTVHVRSGGDDVRIGVPMQLVRQVAAKLRSVRVAPAV